MESPRVDHEDDQENKESKKSGENKITNANSSEFKKVATDKPQESTTLDD